MKRRGILLLALLGLFAACAEEELPLPPAAAGSAGWVEGVVRFAGQPAIARLRFVTSGTAPVREIRLVTESDGSYRVPLPEGKYLLLLDSSFSDAWYAQGGPVSRQQEAETLRVVPGGVPLRADFDLGAIDLRLRLPDWWGDQAFYIVVWSPPDSAGARPNHVASSPDYAPADTIAARLEPLAPGSYLLSIQGSGLGALWLPGSFRAENAEPIPVTSSEATPYSCSLEVRQRLVHGSITGAWQTLSAARPAVRALNDDASIVGETWAEPDGSFVLSVAEARQVRIEMRFDGADRWIGGATFEEAMIIEIPDTGIVTLPPEVDRGLSVRFERGELPPSTWVDCRSYDATGRMLFHSWVEASDAPFAFSGLVPGAYRLRITPDHFGQVNVQHQWFDRAASRDEATWIQIDEDDEVVPVTVTLEPGGIVRGHAACPQEWEWISVVVRAAERDTCLFQFSVPRAEDGSYEILGLSDGAYKLAFGDDWRSCGGPLPSGWIWYGQTADWDSAAVVTITDHGTVEGIDVELPASRPAPAPPASARTRD